MMLVRDMVTTDKQSYTLIILATFLITVPFRSVGVMALLHAHQR